MGYVVEHHSLIECDDGDVGSFRALHRLDDTLDAGQDLQVDTHRDSLMGEFDAEHQQYVVEWFLDVLCRSHDLIRTLICMHNSTKNTLHNSARSNLSPRILPTPSGAK